MDNLEKPDHSDRDSLTQEFDVLYKEEKAVLRRALNKIFRKGIQEGYALALQECKNVSGKKILNIGLGDKLMLLELIKKGAYIVDIEAAGHLSEKAKSAVDREELQDNILFLRDNFEMHRFDEKFNISIALEVFDFTKDAESYVKKMRSLTSEKCIMSFPSKFAVQVPLRMIWLRSRNIPLYFYTKEQLKQLLYQHFAHYKIKTIGARYFCVASVRNKTNCTLKA